MARRGLDSGACLSLVLVEGGVQLAQRPGGSRVVELDVIVQRRRVATSVRASADSAAASPAARAAAIEQPAAAAKLATDVWLEVQPAAAAQRADSSLDSSRRRKRRHVARSLGGATWPLESGGRPGG